MTDKLKQWEYDKGYTKGYSDGRASLIEELEKIKAEIEKLEYESFECNLVLPGWETLEIIDRHIAELKGENK